MTGEQSVRGQPQYTTDRSAGSPGALATASVESGASRSRSEVILPSESAQRTDNDVHLSDEGRQLSAAAHQHDSVSKGDQTAASEPGAVSETKTEQEKLQVLAEVRELSQRDREVRNHERIHASIAGAHGGAPKFQYQRGPDGVLYAVSGSVSVDLSVVPGNAEATVRKAEQIERAALGPSDPSSADRAVAAKARSIANQARVEMTIEQNEEQIAREQEGEHAGISAIANVAPGGQSRREDDHVGHG